MRKLSMIGAACCCRVALGTRSGCAKAVSRVVRSQSWRSARIEEGTPALSGETQNPVRPARSGTGRAARRVARVEEPTRMFPFSKRFGEVNKIGPTSGQNRRKLRCQEDLNRWHGIVPTNGQRGATRTRAGHGIQCHVQG